jgi:hypothetical protein
MSNDRWNVAVVIDGFSYTIIRNVNSADAVCLEIDLELSGHTAEVTPCELVEEAVP